MRHLLPDDQATDRGGDHRVNLFSPVLVGQIAADRLGLVRVLQQQRRLKETVAVQTAAKLEVTGEQRPRLLQNPDDFLFRHLNLFS